VRIAVVQHRVRSTPEDDARDVAKAAELAAGRGAELVFLPDVPSLRAENSSAQELFRQLVADVPAFCLIPNVSPAARGAALATELPSAQGLPADLGVVALVAGDACMDAAQFEQLAATEPGLAVLVPRSESDLQAEAMLELAIALSDSLAGLIVIAECAGAPPGQPGHGGSAIVLLGEVVAEAIGDDDVLVADVPVPIPQPEPREPLPSIPPLLAQRVSVHEGRGAQQPDYPAELS
jgi:predicted amidohydrolase